MKFKTSPALILILGFASIIVLGTLLLGLPFMRAVGTNYSFINALFTATSSVCVTGLTVVDISTYYNVYGQVLIMLLIQIGGLGYMTMASMIFFMVGKRLSIKEQLVNKTAVGDSSESGIMDFVKLAFCIEFIGAVLLSIAWFSQYHWNALYYGLFHSISAFCNAGFSLFPDNLMSSADNTFVLLVVAFLIILGGLGFIVLKDFKIRIWHRERTQFSYHTRVVLIVTSFLIIIPMLELLFSEYNNLATLGGFGFMKKLLFSFFHSVTARTAGFNILDMAGFWHVNLFFMILLMFVGASPSGTGGGIKTTTFAILFSSVRSMLKGTYEVNMFKRRIDDEVVQKSWIILFMSLCFISIILFCILFFERQPFEGLLFEVISAFATVGLSTGITSVLSNPSKFLIILTMFVGRLGPLTLATVVYFKHRKLPMRYAEEKILIG